MTFFEKIKTILATPSLFWESISSETGYRSAFRYHATLTLITALITSVLNSYLLSTGYVDPMLTKELAELSANLGIEGVFVILLAVFGLSLFSLLFTVLAAHWGHFFLERLGGVGKREETYRAWAYASTPAVLGSVISFIPLAGNIASIWSIYLRYQALQKFHKMSIWKVLGADLLAILVALVVFIVLIFAIIGPLFWKG
ncbi:MAG: Yip1 family protein [Patescibacteria group bacterium]